MLESRFGKPLCQSSQFKHKAQCWVNAPTNDRAHASPSCSVWLESIKPKASKIDPLTEAISDHGFFDDSKPLFEHLPQFLQHVYNMQQDPRLSSAVEEFGLKRHAHLSDECPCSPKDFARITMCAPQWPDIPAQDDVHNQMWELLHDIEGASREAIKRLRSAQHSREMFMNYMTAELLEQRLEKFDDEDIFSGVYDLAKVARNLLRRLRWTGDILKQHPHQFSRLISRFRCLAWITAQLVENCLNLVQLSARSLRSCGREPYTIEEKTISDSEEVASIPTRTAYQRFSSSSRNMKTVMEVIVCWVSFSRIMGSSAWPDIFLGDLEMKALVDVESSRRSEVGTALGTLIFGNLLLDNFTGGARVEKTTQYHNLEAELDYLGGPAAASSAERVSGWYFQARADEFHEMYSSFKEVLAGEVEDGCGILEKQALKLQSLALLRTNSESD